MSTTSLQQSKFAVPKMDCSSEETLVRLALEGADVRSLDFDLQGRTLTVVHSGTADAVLSRLEPLKLGATLQETAPAATLGVRR